jgi:hypothetical protein
MFVVHSDERLAYEQAQRAKSMARVRTKLEALERRVANGRRAGGESRVRSAIGIIVAVRNATLSRVFCGAKGPDQGGKPMRKAPLIGSALIVLLGGVGMAAAQRSNV